MHKTSNGLHTEIRKEMISLLNQHLADMSDLYSQTKQAHWNVKGNNFYQLHEMFDQIAENVEGHIDTIAERVTALGGTAMGTIRMASATSKLKEYPSNVFDGMSVVKFLAEQFSNATNSIRDAVDVASNKGDSGTSDLFTEVLRDLDKNLWFLEAHLQSV